MIRITIPVVPVAEPRQRHALVAGRIRNYTSTTHPVNTYKATLVAAPPDVLVAEKDFQNKLRRARAFLRGGGNG